MRLTERVVRAVLRLAPPAFRAKFEADLLETHRARIEYARRRGVMARVVLSVREVAGCMWAVLRLRAGRAAGWRQAQRAARVRKRASALDIVLQDIRLAGRSLRRHLGYTVTAIAVLAVGIGANSAIFSVVNAFFYRPLPFAAADRLVMLYETRPEYGWTDATGAPANVLAWREQVRAFSDIAMYSDFVEQETYIQDGEPVLLSGSSVTGNFFTVLGVGAALGRTFRWDETWQGANAVIVLSHDLWQTQFGADPGIVGRMLKLGTNSLEVVGVMPEGFHFPNPETQYWYTMGWAQENREEVWFRRAHFVRPIARLSPGVTPVEADGQLQAVVRRLQSEYPETNRVMGAGLMPVRDFLIRDVRRPVLILQGAVALLLLLACANVANLTLVRATERSQEMAVRHALGAVWIRVARQVLTESFVLAVLGGVVGLGLGWAGVRAMAGLTPLGIEGATSVALDARVVVFTLLTAAAGAIFFGLAPALRSAARDILPTLNEAGRGSSQGGTASRTAATFVAVEVALALMLVLGAGLMLRSVWLLRHVDPGFRTEPVLAVQLTVPATRYQNRDNVLAFWDGLIESLEARAEIERAGTVARLPLSGSSWSSQFQAEGWPPERVGFEILHRRADRGYFEALGIPLLRGRLFEAGDRADAPLVVLINETFARQHFPGEDAVGQRIAYGRTADENSIWYEIIGIVGDQQQVSPAQPPRAEVFENRNQDWCAGSAIMDPCRSSWVVMRTRIDPGATLPVVRSALREMDPLIAIEDARSLRDVWRASLLREQFILTLLAFFGAAALLLAAVGVYAVAAQAARQRTREIGIRVALGATSPDVTALMLRRSLLLVSLGVAAGLVASLLATKALRSVLYGVAPNDPVTLSGVVLLLATVAGLACYLPARRAARVDPVRSLREG